VIFWIFADIEAADQHSAIILADGITVAVIRDCVFTQIGDLCTVSSGVDCRRTI
jgi:hypothetical protein